MPEKFTGHKPERIKRRRPYLRLFPSDRTFDAKLRLCSRAARDFWSDLYGVVAHFAEPRGYVLIEGRSLTHAELARLFGDCEADVVAYLGELERNGVFSRTDMGDRLGAGVIFCRRMIRETEKEARDQVNGGKGGNPALAEMRRLAELNLGGAISDVEKKAANAARTRRYRERKKSDQAETSVTPVTSHVTHNVTPVTSRVTVDKRHAREKSETKTNRSADVTGVNPQSLYSIPQSILLSEPIAPASSAPTRPPSPSIGGGRVPKRGASKPATNDEDPAKQQAKLDAWRADQLARMSREEAPP